MTSTRPETIFGNARIVLADRVIERGWIAFADGRIAEFGEGDAPAGSEDAGGDLVMPGLIELHTDHLEAHYVPRPKVFWDPIAAVVSYDGQLATSGITTVLDSLAGLARGRRRGSRRPGRRAGRRHRVGARRKYAARRSFPASALRNPDAERGRGSQGTDRPARCAADVADGPYAGTAPVPRRRQAARLLSRQGRAA